MAAGIRVVGPDVARSDEVLTPEALAFVADLQRCFGPRREELLTARAVRREQIAAGVELDTADEPMPDEPQPDDQEDPLGGSGENRQEGRPRGVRVTRELVSWVAEDELVAILAEPSVDGEAVRQAHALFARVALADEFPDFLTLPAYDLID